MAPVGQGTRRPGETGLTCRPAGDSQIQTENGITRLPLGLPNRPVVTGPTKSPSYYWAYQLIPAQWNVLITDRKSAQWSMLILPFEAFPS